LNFNRPDLCLHFFGSSNSGKQHKNSASVVRLQFFDICQMTEYVDDELPLPPFAEIFGEGSMSNKKKSKKMLGARGDPNGDETTG
jgi:hypothetical protein